MVRIIVIVLVVAAAWVLLARLIRASREKRVDWTGIAFFIGFVALAFYLQHATGMTW